jgi:hypothetical protein
MALLLLVPVWLGTLAGLTLADRAGVGPGTRIVWGLAGGWIAALAIVRVQLADVPQVRDAIDQATATIHALREALIAERIGRRVGPGLLGMGSPEFAALWDETREELRAEGLPMGEGR